MFQYTKEIILHGVADRVSVVDATNPYSGVAAKKLLVKRGGEYFSDFILPATAYATEGYYGNPGKLTVNFKGVNLVPGLYQFQFRVKTPNQFFAEYASPNWQVYGKPMLIGFEVTEEMKADVSLAAAKLAELVELALPANNKFIEVVYNEGESKFEIKGTNNFMTFDKALLEWYDPTGCDTCLGEYHPVAIKFDVEDNKEDFGTGEWLVENLRFPTYPNIRYASASEDERPVNGITYVEFSFSYQSPRPGLGGMSGVGQGMTAVTRHIYYVPAGAEADAFKAKLVEAGLSVVVKNAEGKETVETPEVETPEAGE